jgi:hypothetical protein
MSERTCTALAVLFGILFVCLTGLPSLVCLSIVAYFLVRVMVARKGGRS